MEEASLVIGLNRSIHAMIYKHYFTLESANANSSSALHTKALAPRLSCLLVRTSDISHFVLQHSIPTPTG